MTFIEVLTFDTFAVKKQDDGLNHTVQLSVS